MKDESIIIEKGQYISMNNKNINKYEYLINYEHLKIFNDQRTILFKNGSEYITPLEKDTGDIVINFIRRYTYETKIINMNLDFIEQCIKSLLLCFNKNWGDLKKSGHNIKDLFNSLPESVQDNCYKFVKYGYNIEKYLTKSKHSMGLMPDDITLEEFKNKIEKFTYATDIDGKKLKQLVNITSRYPTEQLTTGYLYEDIKFLVYLGTSLFKEYKLKMPLDYIENYMDDKEKSLSESDMEKIQNHEQYFDQLEEITEQVKQKCGSKKL